MTHQLHPGVIVGQLQKGRRRSTASQYNFQSFGPVLKQRVYCLDRQKSCLDCVQTFVQYQQVPPCHILRGPGKPFGTGLCQLCPSRLIQCPQKWAALRILQDRDVFQLPQRPLLTGLGALQKLDKADLLSATGSPNCQTDGRSGLSLAVSRVQVYQAAFHLIRAP